jgi:glucokinase
MTEHGEAPVLAIDIGGTKMMAAVVSMEGRIRVSDVCPTQASEGVSAVVGRLLKLIDELLDQDITEIREYGGIGIACAGGVDTARGLITQSPNLPDWQNIPLARLVGEKYKTDAYLVNDASAAALGEHRFGAGVGASNLVMVTLGTGIGGGIVINKELYLGVRGSAAEIGHMIIDINGPACACGSNGCLESFASGTAIARNAINRIKLGEESALVDMVEGKIEAITAEMVGEAAREEDTLALDILSRAAYYLGIGLVNLVNIFNPEIIVLGGGMTGILEFLMEPARRVVDARAFTVAAESVELAEAQLGNDAGVYGAAAYVFDRLERRPE